MTVCIIRHAHKEKGNFYNPRLHHQDPPISQQGQQESRKLWSYLCEKAISAVYGGNFHVDFCGVTEIAYQQQYRCWKLIRFNQTVV